MDVAVGAVVVMVGVVVMVVGVTVAVVMVAVTFLVTVGVTRAVVMVIVPVMVVPAMPVLMPVLVAVAVVVVMGLTFDGPRPASANRAHQITSISLILISSPPSGISLPPPQFGQGSSLCSISTVSMQS